MLAETNSRWQNESVSVDDSKLILVSLFQIHISFSRRLPVWLRLETFDAGPRWWTALLVRYAYILLFRCFFFVIYVCKKYSIIVVHYLQGISDLTLLVVRQEGHPARKTLGAGLLVVII